MGRRPRLTAIYKITCLVNGKIYIGSSKDVGLRWNSHLYELITYKHSNKTLVRDWHKYGPRFFSFTILDLLDSNKHIKSIEQGYIEAYQTSGKKLYNQRRAKKKSSKE